MDTLVPAPAPFNAPLSPRRGLGPRALLATGFVLIFVIALVGAYMRMHSPALPKKNTSGPPETPQTAYDQDKFTDALAKLDYLLKSYTKPVPNFTYMSALVLKSQTLSQEGYLTFQEMTYGPQAAAVAQQAILLDATSSEAYRALGFADQIQHGYADAHTAYQKAAALDPKNALALAGDARVYQLEGDLVKAKAGYLAALAANSNCYAADIGLGQIAAVKGDITGAIPYFNAVTSSDLNVHDRAQAFYSLGMLRLRQGNFSTARGNLTIATTFDSTYASPWLGLGIEYYAESLASSTSAKDRIALSADSPIALSRALGLIRLDEPGKPSIHTQIPSDLYVVGNTHNALAALSALAAGVSTNIGIPGTANKKILIDRINALGALIKAGPSLSK